MDSVKSYLTRDHRECDSLLADVEVAAHTRNWTEAERGANALLSAMSAHFAKEERVWFSYLEKHDSTMAAATADLRSEHSRMLALARLLASAAVWRDPQAVYDTSHSLYCIMVRHNENEERSMFARSSELADAQSARLIARMESVAGSTRARQP